jgi:outer membrane lipoprotein-sorting protein
MKRRSSRLRLPALLAPLLLAFSPARAAEIDVNALVREVEQSLRGDTAEMKAQMTVTTPRFTRVLEFRSWDDQKGRRSFTRILEPTKDRGTGFLKLGTTLWTYLPRVERITRMPPSLLLQSWMGSDFTNDDIVRESSLVKDYQASLIGEQDVDGVPAFGIRLLAREEAPVVWARLDAFVERGRPVPLLFVYFDEPNPGEYAPVRRMRFSDVRPVQGRAFPHLWVMEAVDKPGQTTTLRIEEVRFDAPLDDAIFTHEHLKRAEAVR